MEEANIVIGRVKAIAPRKEGGPHPISGRSTKNKKSDPLSSKRKILQPVASSAPLPLLALSPPALVINLFLCVYTPY